MKTVLIACLFALLPTLATAQSVIIVGPTTVLQWDDTLTPLATAQTLVVSITVDGNVPPIVLSPVTCVVNPVTATTSTCSSLLSQIPTGSHTINATNTSGTVVSLPSAPFSYVTMLIPVPQTLRVK